MIISGSSLRLVSCRKLKDGDGFVLKTADDLVVLATNKILNDGDKRIRKIGVSLSSGCGVGCVYCFTAGFKKFRQLSADEIFDQVFVVMEQSGWSHRGYNEIKISFKQMGDPRLNPENTVEAIGRLAGYFPGFTYVVSTSAPKIEDDFFADLGSLCRSGIKMRLQFSCHTTSDAERAELSPVLAMMSLDEIAEVVRNWPGPSVTLNFVVFDGMEYNAGKIEELFDPKHVFVKINYIDDTAAVRSRGLKDGNSDVKEKFVKQLQKRRFGLAQRRGAESYER